MPRASSFFSLSCLFSHSVKRGWSHSHKSSQRKRNDQKKTRIWFLTADWQLIQNWSRKRDRIYFFGNLSEGKFQEKKWTKLNLKVTFIKFAPQIGSFWAETDLLLTLSIIFVQKWRISSQKWKFRKFLNWFWYSSWISLWQFSTVI